MTNQGTEFTSKLLQRIMENYKIKHQNSIPYHPRSNGQVEYTNKVVESILTKTIKFHRRDYEQSLREALLAYCTTWINTTRHSPYELLYGKQVFLPIEFQVETSKQEQSWDLIYMKLKNKG